MKLTNKELEALSKMRNKEKQQKIVDAVNALQGELTHDNCYFYGGDKYLHRTETGNYCTVSVVAKDMTGFICTVEEFNQCVKEMAFHTGSSAHADYLIAIDRASRKEKDTQLQSKYSGWDPSQGHANCRCTDKKQIEWKNGDECIYKNNKNLVLTYIGEHSSKAHHVVHCERNGLTSIAHGYLEKPPTKEKRWIAYNTIMNEVMSRGHKTKDDCYNSMLGNKFRDKYQYIEIEINV